MNSNTNNQLSSLDWTNQESYQNTTDLSFLDLRLYTLNIFYCQKIKFYKLYYFSLIITIINYWTHRSIVGYCDIFLIQVMQFLIIRLLKKQKYLLDRPESMYICIQTNNAFTKTCSRVQMSTSLKNDWYENFTVLAVVLIIITTILVSRGRRKIILANRIPGPRGSFIIGNLNMAFGGSKLFINKLFKEYRK